MSSMDVPVSKKSMENSEFSLKRKFTLSRLKEQIIHVSLFFCAIVSILTTVGIIYTLVSEAVYAIPPNTAFFQDISLKEFFTDKQWTPQYAEKHFGVLPLLSGSFMIVGIAALIGLPVGLLSAIYISEYSSPKMRTWIKPILEILAGIPTVVYGYFALIFITPYILRPIFQDWMGIDVGIFNAASAGMVVGIMIIPMVCSLSEDALRAVPSGLREAAFALGSTKYDVSTKVVLPAASSGILASFLLAISRALGETMAVTIAAGQTPSLSLNPFQSVQTMTAYIVNVSMGDTPAGSLAYKSLYAIALTLFVITFGMNLLSQFILSKYREVYE